MGLLGETGETGEGGPQVLRPPPGPLRPLGPGWSSHRVAATVVVVLAAGLPAGLALAVTGVLARDWNRPDGFANGAAWWLVLAAIAWVVIEAAHVVTRRLFPLATLLHMGLAFPGAAPSRFRLALRAGNSRRLQQSPTTRGGAARDDISAAGLMLELVSDLSHHDRSTRGHSERVRAYTEMLATELGISSDDRQRLRWAGLLHDIGKLETPAEILNKPGSLTEDEFTRIQQHPLDGLRLAMPLWAWLGDNVLAVSDHHERWEGGGYPSGAAGTDIAVAGRIVAVADAFDVMTSSRSYKAPISLQDARAELVRCSGTQFDPDMVRAFLAIDLRDLRRVAGVLAMFTPIPALRRQLAARSAPVRSALGAAGVASSILAVSLVAPIAGVEVAAPEVRGDRVTAPAAAPVPLAPRAPDDVDPARSPVTADVDGPDRVPRQSPTGDGSPVAAPTDAIATPPDPQPAPRPSPGDPPPPPPTGTPVGVVVDPATGGVHLEGVAPTGPIELVELEAVGNVTCNGVGLCEPIEVTLPITIVSDPRSSTVRR